LGRMTCKIVSEMTYNLSRGTLNHTIPDLAHFCLIDVIIMVTK